MRASWKLYCLAMVYPVHDILVSAPLWLFRPFEWIFSIFQIHTDVFRIHIWNVTWPGTQKQRINCARNENTQLRKWRLAKERTNIYVKRKYRQPNIAHTSEIHREPVIPCNKQVNLIRCSILQGRIYSHSHTNTHTHTRRKSGGGNISRLTHFSGPIKYISMGMEWWQCWWKTLSPQIGLN